MKRLLMLEPTQCGSSDFTKGKIYGVTDDKLFDNKQEQEIKFNRETWLNNDNMDRYISIIDDGNVEDSFIVCEPEDRFIIFDNDKELALYLLNNVENLDNAIVNLYLTMYNIK